MIATGGREVTLRPNANRGGTDRDHLYSYFLPKKHFSQDGLKLLPGRSLTDFGTPIVFSKILSNRPRENNPTGPGRAPGGSPDIFPKTQKLTENLCPGPP